MDIVTSWKVLQNKQEEVREDANFESYWRFSLAVPEEISLSAVSNTQAQKLKLSSMYGWIE